MDDNKTNAAFHPHTSAEDFKAASEAQKAEREAREEALARLQKMAFTAKREAWR